MVIISAVFYSGQIITAQIMGNTCPQFQLNLIRFSAQTMISLIMIFILKQNVFDLKESKDAWIIFAGSTAYTWFIFSMCLAPLYAPVGKKRNYIYIEVF